MIAIFLLMLDLYETIDQLAISNSVHWCGYMLRREEGHAMKTALDYEVKGRRNKMRPKST